MSNKSNIRNDERFSIIIPLKDEQINLRKNINNYKKLYDDGHEIILINDNSKDETSQILQKSFKFAKVINLKDEPPKDVIGKNWALITGYKHATKEWILFLDADVIVKTLDNYKNLNKNEVYSCLPIFENDYLIGFFSFFFYQLLILNFYYLKTKTEVFGGFYIINRNLYEKIGGHEIVKDQVLEDLEMGKLISKNGKILVNYNQNIKIHMYDNLSQAVEGWSKNIALGAKSIETKRSLFLIFYLVLIILFLTTYFWATYLVLIILFKLIFNKYINAKFIYYFIWPITLIFFLLIFLKSILKINLTWKGRKI